MIPELEFADEPIFCPYCGDVKSHAAFDNVIYGVTEEEGLVCLCYSSVMNHLLSGMIFHVFVEEKLLEENPEFAAEPVEIM